MSRPALLLERELHRISRTPESASPWGISAEVVLNDIFDWQCTILGPLDTPWEGGIFKVRLAFSEDYNQVPPKVHFETVPFHPNIDMHTGVPCVDFLDNGSEWNCDTSIFGLLLALQNLIQNPILENPINLPAAEIYAQSPRLYDQLCRDCVVASRRIDAGLRPHSGTLFESHGRIISLHGDSESNANTPTNSHNTAPHQQQQPQQHSTPTVPLKPKIARLSFEEYHRFWKNAATALPPEPATSADPSSNPAKSLRPLALRLDGVTPNSRMTQRRFRDLVESQRYLWYGRFDRMGGGKDRVKEANERSVVMLPRKASSNTAGMTNTIPNTNTNTYGNANATMGYIDCVASEAAEEVAVLPDSSYSEEPHAGSDEGNQLLLGLPKLPPTVGNTLRSSLALPPNHGILGFTARNSVALAPVLAQSQRASALDLAGDGDGSDWEQEAMELEQWANDLDA